MGRNLSDAERAVIATVVDRAGALGELIATDLAGQLAGDLTVARQCDCGTCYTIDLAYRGRPLSKEHPSAVVEATVADGSAGVLLFVDGGIVSCLEIYPLTDAPATLPEPGDLVGVAAG